MSKHLVDNEMEPHRKLSFLTKDVGIDSHKIGIFVAVLTFVGTIIGGGVVGLPKAFYFTGILFGIIMNILCGLGSVYAVSMLI